MMEYLAKTVGYLLGISLLAGGVFYVILLLRILFRKRSSGNIHFNITVKTEDKPKEIK